MIRSHPKTSRRYKWPQVTSLSHTHMLIRGNKTNHLRWNTLVRTNVEVEKLDPLRHCCGSAKWCSHYRKQYGAPQKIKTRTTTWSSDLISGYLSKITEIRVSKTHEHIYVQYSIIHNSQDLEATQLSTDRWLGKENMGYVCTQRDVIQPFERWNSAICDNINEPWGPYAKWHKPVTER